MGIFILTALKIIGLILLAAVVLLIVLAALVLFVPVRYRAWVEGEASALLELPLELRASWLLHIVRLHITGVGEQRVVLIKLLFATVKRFNLSRAEGSEESEDADEYGESGDFGDSDDSEQSSEPEELGIFERIREIVSKIRDFYNFSDRDEIIRLTIILVKKLIKASTPKKFHVRGEIGFDKPDMTGYFFAGVGMVSAFTGLDIKINGNFERPIANLTLEAKGRISFFSILWPIARYTLSRPLWGIVKNIFFKKERV